MSTPRRPLFLAPRFLPLVGAAIGAVGGGVYWLAAQVWPSSVAVLVSMWATALLVRRLDAAEGVAAETAAQVPAPELLRFVFAMLLKYSALMALSAANLPFPLPANLALGLIMIAGYACSGALVVSMRPATYMDLGIALAVGFAPAALIGMPGLVGLAAAVAARLAVMIYIRRRPRPGSAADLGLSRQMTEISFYLGALAARAYI